MRSVSEVHGNERDGLPFARGVRDGECRFTGFVAVKDTILDVEQTKSVSMPSEVFLDAGVDVDRIAGRAGSVNERRPVVEGCGACSGAFEEAGTDMTGPSCKHSRVELKPSGESRAGREGVCIGRSVCTCERFECSWLMGVSRCLAAAALGRSMRFTLISGPTPRSASDGRSSAGGRAHRCEVKTKSMSLCVWAQQTNAPVVPATLETLVN